MRISTASFHQTALDAIEAKSVDLAKIQGQVASGQKIQTPADDPVGMVNILQLKQTLAQSQQFGKNSDAATARLSQEDQALSDVTDLLQNVRDLSVQATSGNAGSDPSVRASLSNQLDQVEQQLLATVNRRDSNGDYLFSGLAAGTQPFGRNGAGIVTYAGDQGTRAIQVAQNQRIADGDSGFSAFVNVPNGNGTFIATASSANTGTGSIGSTSVAVNSTWVSDTYTISFTSASAYQVTNSANAVVASGSFAPGNTLTFNGTSITLQGQPAAGDSFTVAPAGTQSVFATLDSLRAALNSPIGTAANQARYVTSVGNTLTQLDQAIGHVSDVRASVGARLNAVDAAKSSGSGDQIDLQKSLSQLQDLDYASAISQLTLTQTGLQAAEASYSRISQLSLFDYLK